MELFSRTGIGDPYTLIAGKVKNEWLRSDRYPANCLLSIRSFENDAGLRSESEVRALLRNMIKINKDFRTSHKFSIVQIILFYA